MFYFNDSPVSPSELDLEQYQKIYEFRKSIGKQGVYYFTYKKTEDFQSFAQMHLGKVMEDFGNNWGKGLEAAEKIDDVENEPKEDISVDAQIEEDVEAGFLDSIISTVEDLKSAQESMNRMASLLQELNTKTTENTEEINKLPKPYNPVEARLLVDRQAGYWDEFAKRVEAELPILSARFRSGMQSYTKSAQLLVDFESKDKDMVIGALEAIKNLKSVAKSSQESTGNFKAAIQRIPRMSVKLNHAKRYILRVIDNIIDEYKAEENLASEAEKLLIDVLGKIDPPV